jgi:hypothetical protein
VSLRALIASLEAEQAETQDDIRRGFALARALAAVLSDLFDEWGGDYERDQRLPPGLQEGMASAARGEIEPFGDFSGHVEDEGEYEALLANTCSPEEAKRRIAHARRERAEVIRPRSHLGSPMLFPVSHFLPSVNTDGECARCGAMHSKGPCP